MENQNRPLEEQTDNRQNRENTPEYKEEFAAEVAEPRQTNDDKEDARSPFERDRAGENNRTFGGIALTIAILSLFVWPSLLGPSAVVLGFLAWNRGSRALGIWSVVIGLISFLAFVFLTPMLG